VVSVTGKNDTTPAAAAKNSNATTDNKPDANKDVKHKQAATSSKGGKDSGNEQNLIIEKNKKKEK
jgi:hypothetical protein